MVVPGFLGGKGNLHKHSDSGDPGRGRDRSTFMTTIAVQAITLQELLTAHGSAVNALPFDTLLDCFGEKSAA